MPTADAPVLGPEEHWTVNAFVVESTTALAQANAALHRHGAPGVPDPPSTARMLAFLKKAQRQLRGTAAEADGVTAAREDGASAEPGVG